MFPLSVAYFASACSSKRAMFVTVPSFDEPAATFAPTESAGSGRTLRIDTTSDGAAVGRSSISAPTLWAEMIWLRIATTVPSTGA